MNGNENQTPERARLEFISRIGAADRQTVDLMRRTFSMFGALTKEEAVVVVRKLRGETNNDIVISTRLSKQVVWRRFHFLKEKNQVWSALSNGNEGIRGGGRKVGGPGGRRKRSETAE